MLRTIWSTAIAALVGATLLLTPETSDAQRGGGGGGRGGGGGGGRGGSWNGSSWNGGRGGQGRGWYGGGYGPGYGLGFGLGFGGGYGWGGDPYYGYDYATPAYSSPPASIPQYSYYPPQSGNYLNAQTQLANANDAGFIVQVPDPNAEVWFEDYKTQQRGTVRHYESSTLEPNHAYTFTIRVRWVQNGQQMDQTRQVQGRAGQIATVDFTTVPREQIPAGPRVINDPGSAQQPPIILPNRQGIRTPGNQLSTPVPTQQIPTAPRKEQRLPLNPPSQEAPPQ